MNKVYGYEQTQAFDGSFESVPAGGHVCKILKAACEKATSSGADMLVLLVDIAEGSRLDGVYRRMYDSKRATKPDAKWPCIYRQPTTDREGNCSPYFKGLIEAIEKSNPGYSFVSTWDERTLAGKSVGMVFREEEYMAQDTGEIKTIVKPAFPRSVQAIRDGVEVPELKRLNTVQRNTAAAFNALGMMPEVTDENELPF